MFVHGSAVDVPIGPIVAGVEGGEVLSLGEGGGPAAHLHKKKLLPLQIRFRQVTMKHIIHNFGK